jgi:hypothetical protein
MKTVINKHTGEVLFATMTEVELADNQIAIDDLVSENFNRAFWDFEKATFYDFDPVAWSKEAHLAEINALHEEEFKRRLLAAEYVGEWELNAVLADSENEYFDEAVLIINYWWNGWDAIKAYSETVTEENFIDPIQFVNDL